MPLYGRYFSGTTGLGQTFSASNGNMIYKYNTLPKPGAVEMSDSIAGATYSYDPTSKELVSYDTVSSVQNKAEYIHSKGLGGSIFWEASGDRNDSGSLIAGSFAALSGIDTSWNLLSYPNSRYANIAAGMPEE
jgi:chitinase